MLAGRVPSDFIFGFMKFQSNILSDARGKLNGMVFSKNRYASIVRNKTSPVQPNTTAQMNRRQTFGALSASFRGLTVAQIAAWNAAVANWPRSNTFGQQYLMSGLNLFVGLNNNLSTSSSPTISNPPLPVELPVFKLQSASLDSAGLGSLAFTPTVPAGYVLVLRSTPPLSAGRDFVKSLFRQIVVAPALTASPFLFGPAFVARYGLPSVGTKVTLEAYLINTTTGQATVATTIATIVT